MQKRIKQTSNRTKEKLKELEDRLKVLEAKKVTKTKGE